MSSFPSVSFPHERLTVRPFLLLLLEGLWSLVPPILGEIPPFSFFPRREGPFFFFFPDLSSFLVDVGVLGSSASCAGATLGQNLFSPRRAVCPPDKRRCPSFFSPPSPLRQYGEKPLPLKETRESFPFLCQREFPSSPAWAGFSPS